MALKDLTQADFDFWVNYNKEMRRTHEREFLNEIDPELMRFYYRGFRRNPQMDANQAHGSSSFGVMGDSAFQSQTRRKPADYLTLSRIFTATNTIQPSLYWQNPRKIVLPRKGANPQNAAIMSALQNYYMNLRDQHGNTQKQENQNAIMNAWFFGLGWKKISYQIETEPDSRAVEDKLAQPIPQRFGATPDNTEGHFVRPEIIRYERLLNTSESPANVMIDHRGDLSNYKVISQMCRRTLHELKTSGLYEPETLSEVEEKFTHENGSRFNDREIDLNIFEMMMEQRNGIWIMTFVEDFNKPLRYDKSASVGRIPWSPIAFTNEPGVRYPVSHMKVASNIQDKIDKVVNTALEQVSKHRSQHVVNKSALEKGQDKAFLKNKVGGVVWANRAMTAGDIQELKTTPINSDYYNFITLLQQTITEVVGVDQQRITGRSSNKTLGQDELAAVGTQVREGGMLDRVRDWIINQSDLEGEQLQQFASGPTSLNIIAKDFSQKELAEDFQPETLEFFSENQPLPVNMFIQGKYDYDTNIYEAVKPDKQVLQQEYMQLLELVANPQIQDAFLTQGIRVRVDQIAEAMGKAFEHIDASQFLEKLDPRQVAATQAAQVLKGSGGVVPQQPMPQEEQMALEQEGALEQEAAKQQGKNQGGQ